MDERRTAHPLTCLHTHMTEKEAKKEAFRKYLESTGVLDALTKVLVALYEQNDKEKPSSAVDGANPYALKATGFVQQKLGGPTICEYEKLKAEISDLQIKYNELSVTHQKTCKELEELRCSKSEVRKETFDRDIPKDGSWGGI
ncbi:hypothetical protein C5167_043905 [Papaver somniferum]|uniref:Uncharacterized protein n=1 Tax=Papaver somniferum TaxID=3469 RepID=A0A4Y7L9I3_PAPSO|nr:hypothetical protein C5167_043905 [Papaver somniferum]